MIVLGVGHYKGKPWRLWCHDHHFVDFTSHFLIPLCSLCVWYVSIRMYLLNYLLVDFDTLKLNNISLFFLSIVRLTRLVKREFESKLSSTS